MRECMAFRKWKVAFNSEQNLLITCQLNNDQSMRPLLYSNGAHVSRCTCEIAPVLCPQWSLRACSDRDKSHWQWALKHLTDNGKWRRRCNSSEFSIFDTLNKQLRFLRKSEALNGWGRWRYKNSPGKHCQWHTKERPILFGICMTNKDPFLRCDYEHASYILRMIHVLTTLPYVTTSNMVNALWWIFDSRYNRWWNTHTIVTGLSIIA